MKGAAPSFWHTSCDLEHNPHLFFALDKISRISQTVQASNVPRAESIEKRKEEWERTRTANTERNLRSAIPRWNGFVAGGGDDDDDGEPYDAVEIERFLKEDGSIRQQFSITGAAFANCLNGQDDMTFAMFQNSMNFLKSKLEYQLYVVSLPYPDGYVRSISQVKTIETDLKKAKQDVKKKKSDGQYEFCDITAKLDNQIETEQMLDGAKRLLDNDLGGMSELVALQTNWYIPSTSWPAGLEDALLNLAIPYYRSAKSAVDAALRQYNTHTERSERCLVTARA